MQQTFLAISLAAAAAAGSAPADTPRPSATLVLDASDEFSALSLAALQREIEAIPDLRYELSWVEQAEVTVGREFERPIRVRLRGRCHLRGLAPASHIPGPFAWTHVVDGRVLPFIDVDCDRIRGALFSVMWGEDFQHRDFLFARAVARVLAHELHHVLEDVEHAHAGLSKPKLTAAHLIRGEAWLYSEFETE